MHVHGTHRQWLRYSLVASLLGVAPLAGCVLLGTGDDSPFNDVMAIDTRPYVQSADVSGLPAGDHSLSFVVYVQNGRKWSDEYEHRLRRGIRVRKLRPYSGDVQPKVDVEPISEKPDRAMVTVTLPMGDRQTWAMLLSGSDVIPITSQRVGQFDFDEPETLSKSGVDEPYYFIRTSESCPHAVEGVYHTGENGKLERFELRMSEPLPDSFVTSINAADVDGPDLGVLKVSRANDGRSVELVLPADLPANSGIARVKFAADAGLRGRFAEDFTCGEADLGFTFLLGTSPADDLSARPPLHLSPSLARIAFFGVPK